MVCVSEYSSMAAARSVVMPPHQPRAWSRVCGESGGEGYPKSSRPPPPRQLRARPRDVGESGGEEQLKSSSPPPPHHLAALAGGGRAAVASVPLSVQSRQGGGCRAAPLRVADVATVSASDWLAEGGAGRGGGGNEG